MKNNIFQKQNNFNDKTRTSGVTGNTFSHINSDDILRFTGNSQWVRVKHDNKVLKIPKNQIANLRPSNRMMIEMGCPDKESGTLKSSTAIVLSIDLKQTDWSLRNTGFDTLSLIDSFLFDEKNPKMPKPSFAIKAVEECQFIYLLDKEVWFNSKRIICYFNKVKDNLSKLLKQSIKEKIFTEKNKNKRYNPVLFSLKQLKVVDNHSYVIAVGSDGKYTSIPATYKVYNNDLLQYSLTSLNNEINKIMRPNLKSVPNLFNFRKQISKEKSSMDEIRREFFENRKNDECFKELYSSVQKAENPDVREFRWIQFEDVIKYISENKPNVTLKDIFEVYFMLGYDWMQRFHKITEIDLLEKSLLLQKKYFNDRVYALSASSMSKVLERVKQSHQRNYHKRDNAFYRDKLQLSGCQLNNYLMYSEGDINYQQFLSNRKINKEQKILQVGLLKQQGFSMRQIATKTRISLGSVSNYLKKYQEIKVIFLNKLKKKKQEYTMFLEHIASKCFLLNRNSRKSKLSRKDYQEFKEFSEFFFSVTLET